jgi:7-cyano-7-deazaguanine synthase in queuosine biosynthesis
MAEICGEGDPRYERTALMHVAVYLDEKPTTLDAPVSHWLKVGGNLITGEVDFARQFGEPTSLERDLLLLASAIFASDILIQRGRNEAVVRTIHLTMPVVNFHALESQRVALERILQFLSHDNWTIKFLPLEGAPAPYVYPTPNNGKTLLFSGGLDSLAAAVELLDRYGAEHVQLSSHVTGNTAVRGAQNRLHSHLEQHYSAPINRTVIHIGGSKKDEEAEWTDDPEITQRTRSFTFLTIAVLAARRRAMSEVVMIAENGYMAIHLPLSGGRIGAFSTHTAHPRFVREVSNFFEAVLQYPIKVENPFVHWTKGEVVAALARDHQNIISHSNSCWKSSRIGGLHCGECIPCCLRRIALEYHGVRVDTWKRDLFAEDLSQVAPMDNGKRNLTELAAFTQDFLTLQGLDMDFKHPDLLSGQFDHDAVVEMYKRAAREAHTVLSRYPNLAHLI